MGTSSKLTVAVADVVPNDGNPREDFGDLAALGRTFAANGGQPYTPIIVVPDGGRWRLVDGERRWRAMREIGTERCEALVFEEMADAEAAVAMMATDDSKALDARERARGFQTMLALGVDDEVAAAIARTDAATVRRVRRIAAEAPEQATLDALIAAADDEFSEDERAQILRSDNPFSSPGDVADRIRKGHERARRMQAIRDAMPAGVDYRDGNKPYDPERDGLIYLATARKPEAAERLAAKHDGAEGLVAYEDGIGYALYRTASEDDLVGKEAEEARVRQLRDEHIAAYEEAYAAMCRWATEPWCTVDAAAQQQRRQTGAYRPCTRRLALCEAVGDWLFGTHPWRQIIGGGWVGTILGPAASISEDDDISLRDVCCYLIARHRSWGLIGWSGTDVNEDYAGLFAEVYDALVSDGWQPTDGARALREMCLEVTA